MNGSFLLHTIKKEKQGNALKTSQCLVARRNFYGTYVFTHGPAVFAGLQQAYALVYSLDPDGETGCRLTLCRTGSSQRMDSKYMAVAPEFGYRVLQYLCENGVQPEIWQDVVAELDAAQQTEQEGGAWRGQ